MKTRRFFKSIVQTAKSNDAEMPYARGQRRAAMIAKRTTKPVVLKSA